MINFRIWYYRRAGIHPWAVPGEPHCAAQTLLLLLRDDSSGPAALASHRTGPPVGKPIQIEISAETAAVIDETAAKINQGLAEIGGFVDIEDGRAVPGIEWQIDVDRAQAAKFGADISLIGGNSPPPSSSAWVSRPC